MKRCLLAVTLGFVFTAIGFSQAAADAPASKEDVERYLAVMHSHEMMQQTMTAMIKPMHQMMHEQYIKDKDKLPADFEERMNKIMDDMLKDLPLDEMLDAMVPTYQKHFSKGDLDALVVFYSSPTGQKVLRELPAVMADAMQSMMPLMRKSMDKMTERVQQEAAQLSKDSPKDAVSGAPAAKN
jgi:hypothetical protein